MESNAKASMTSEQRALIEEEDRYRQKFAEDRYSSELDDQHLLLHDVFNLPSDQWQYKPLTNEEKNVPALLTQHAEATTGRAIVGSLSEFQNNFKDFTQNMFNGLDWNNVFIAGGAVLGPLTNKGGADTYGKSDIDVFIYGFDDDDAANRKLKQIHSLIQRNTNSQGSVIRTKRTVTIINNYPYRHVQIILKLYKTPAEILLGFDVDCCTFGYDGSRVWAMERGRRAVTRRYNLVNETRRSTSYEGRLYKYSKRGFIVLVPGLDKNRVNSGVYQMRPWQATGLAKLLIFDSMASQGTETEQEDESDYNPDIQIPWGPEWTTSRILARLNAKDKSQFYASRFRDHNSGVSSGPYHNHLFITGIDELIQGQFWCDQCQQNLQLASEDAPGNFVSTRVTWVKKCPAYQDIDKGFKRELLSGSFQPALDPDWKGLAYSGPPATFVPTKSRGGKAPRKSAKKPFAKAQRMPFARPMPAGIFSTAPSVSIPAQPAVLGGDSFTCSICNSTFNSQNLLRKHVRDTGHFDGLGAVGGPVSTPALGQPPQFQLPTLSQNQLQQLQQLVLAQQQTVPASPFITSIPTHVASPPPSSFLIPATKHTVPVVVEKESVDRFNEPAADPFVTDISQFGPQPGSSSPSSFSFGYSSPVPSAHSSSYDSPYKPASQTSHRSAAAVTGGDVGSYEEMNPAARALYLISQCYRAGHVTESGRHKLKELFIRGSEIITAAVEVYDIDNDLNELFDTLKRVAQS